MKVDLSAIRRCIIEGDGQPVDIDKLLEEVKERASGMQSVAIYKEYYESARSAMPGQIFDVGTGQGASTIAYALGAKARSAAKSEKVYAFDQFYQLKTGPHPFSAADAPDHCVEMNLKAFESNLVAFAVEDIVQVFPGKLDALPKSLAQSEIALLSLDTDGYIDRDFALFYDNVLFGGLIVIDDYSDRVNRHGRKNLDAVKGRSEADVWRFIEKKREAPLSGGARILGKHILTHRLSDYFASVGLIEITYVLENTAFCRKIAKNSFGDLAKLEDVQDLKAGIEREFLRRARG